LTKLKPAKQLPTFSASEEFERLYVRPKPGRTLIVGSYITEGKADRRLLHADACGVDMRDGPGVDDVVNLEIFPFRMVLGLFDHVECLSVLEHSRRPWLLAANIERLMLPASTLHLSVPFVWRVHSHPSDYWRMTTDAVRELFPLIEWQTLLYGDIALHEGVKSPAMRDDKGNLYVSRSEVFGFGVRV
jgi:hypothetical protein